MKHWSHFLSIGKDESGAVLIIFVLIIPVIIGMTALAVDVGHLYGVRNELNNAADAGSLAGAAVLFFDDGTINADADNAGEQAAAAHSSGTEPITEITGEIGHWCFSCNEGKGEFSPIADVDLAPTTLVGVSDHALDTDGYFVNAVKIVATRSDTPSFFAKIFGYDQFFVRAEAVAYIGFASKSLPGDLDLPIAVCEQSILLDGKYSCNVGRAISSSDSSTTGVNTGGWTDFDQQSCNAPSRNEVSPYIACPRTVTLPGVAGGTDVNVSGGQVSPTWVDLYDYWHDCAQYDSDDDGVEDASLNTDEDGMPDKLWNVTLPVVDCDGNNTGCSEVVGFVNLTIAWINVENKGPLPTKMETFSCDPIPDPNNDVDREICWNQFIEAFQLRNFDPSNPDGPQPLLSPPLPQDKVVYFLPSCEEVDAFGTSGGRNFGIRAKIPIIVQ